MIAEVLIVAIDLWDLLVGVILFVALTHFLKKRRGIA